jgi:hypothetical protein
VLHILPPAELDHGRRCHGPAQPPSDGASEPFTLPLFIAESTLRRAGALSPTPPPGAP